MHSIVLANQKGGVGKTTTAIHLAHGLALAGKRVALLDLDPQGNATVALQGMTGGSGNDEEMGGLISVCPRLWLLPSQGAGHLLEQRPMIDAGSATQLAHEIQERIDWLVVDSPPRLDEWGWTGLQLCDEVIVPVQAEFFAMHGLSQMLGALDLAREQLPGKARLRGILPTMVGLAEPVATEILEDLRRNLGPLVMESVILRDAQVVEAASHGKTVFAHSPWSASALCYSELVREILDG